MNNDFVNFRMKLHLHAPALYLPEGSFLHNISLIAYIFDDLEMALEYRFINFEDFTLPYITFGHGSQLLIAFHGYLLEAGDFKVFSESLGHEYTIVAFDLFYHGAHALSVREILPPVDSYAIARIIEKLLWETKHVRFSLMGYSLGGRIVMSIVQRMPHRVKEVFLLAPDGLKREFHEEFVTNTYAGDILFRKLIKKPAAFFSICNALLKMHLIHEKLYRFIVSNMDTEESRLHVYRTWNIFKKLRPELKLVAHYINSRHIRLLIFMGKDDKIIKPQYAKRLTKRIKNTNCLYLLDCGHQLLQKSDDIAEIILGLKDH